MRLIKRAFIFLINPIVLSFLLVLIILPFLPRISKFTIEFIQEQTISIDDRIMYYDFDNDGNDEKIIYYNKFDSFHQAFLIHSNGLILDQWHFEGKRLKLDFCFFGDFNNDNNGELYWLTYENDSVFLNFIEPFSTDKIHNKRFVLKTENMFNDLASYSNELYDLNNDGYKEIIFTLAVGYSKHPRKIIAFDRMNDTVIISPQSCYVLDEFDIEDLDGDGKCEIYVNGSAYGNCEDSAQFSDRFAWLMMFDNNLDFLFNPIKLGNNPSKVKTKPFKPQDEPLIACLYIFDGTTDSSSIKLFNLSGQLVKEKYFPDNNSVVGAKLLSQARNHKKLFIVFKNGSIYEIDENLNFRLTSKIEELSNFTTIAIDIDRDSEDEFIFFCKNNQKLIITRNDFTHPIEINFPSSRGYFSYSVNHQVGKPNQLVLKFDEQVYFYNLFETRFYNYRVLIYVGLYVFILLILTIISRFQKYRLMQKHEDEKRITELHIKSLKNQIDPHYTMNFINTIASLFERKETKKASYLFEKYIELLQKTIQSSDKVLTTIKEELKFVQNYLDLEQSRLQQEFNYIIEVEDNIDQQIEIPKTLIHTFVENAIKHGIRPMENTGVVKIAIKKDNIQILIHISDNGIGRAEADKLQTFGTKSGLKILDQLIHYYYKYKKVKMSYDIIDRKNESKSEGTLVIIRIPLTKSIF